MEEYDDNIDSSVELSLQSGEWTIRETQRVIAEYKACKSVHAQVRLISRMEYMLKRLSFERNELGKLIDL